MDLLKMGVVRGCDEDGEGGTPVVLPKEGIVIKGEEEAESPEKAPLARAIAAAHRKHGAATLKPNPDWKGNIPTGPDNLREIEVPGLSPFECLTYEMQLRFFALVDEQIQHESNIAAAAALEAEKAASREGAKTV